MSAAILAVDDNEANLTACLKEMTERTTNMWETSCGLQGKILPNGSAANQYARIFCLKKYNFFL